MLYFLFLHLPVAPLGPDLQLLELGIGPLNDLASTHIGLPIVMAVVHLLDSATTFAGLPDHRGTILTVDDHRVAETSLDGIG